MKSINNSMVQESSCIIFDIIGIVVPQYVFDEYINPIYGLAKG